MEFKLRVLLRYCVLVHMILELQGRPVFSAPANKSCEELNRAIKLSELLKHEVKALRLSYTIFHGPRSNSSKEDVPDSTVSGVNVSEKLQDVYVKNILFNWHVLNVSQHHSEKWDNKEPVAELLKQVKVRLSYQLTKVKHLLEDFFKGMPLPPTPALPNVNASHGYAKKEYGWIVLVNLTHWEEHVLQLLEEMKNMCVPQKPRHPI